MNYAIVLAAGESKRMRTKTDKLFVHVAGKPVLYYSLVAFQEHPLVDEIVVVGNEENCIAIEKLVEKERLTKVIKVLIGKNTRQNSMKEGLYWLRDKRGADLVEEDGQSDIVLVHNGANPLPSFDEITEVVSGINEVGACIVGHSMTATVKEVADAEVVMTHDRRKLFAVETPQGAQFKLLLRAVEAAEKNDFEATDEAMLLESIGQKVRLVEASDDNFKITKEADINRLRAVLGELPEDYRVGIGQDSHHFDFENKGLMLGGVELPEEQAMEANSDGDVILHALFNALSQAIGDKSLGFYADPMCEAGITDSVEYLKVILKKVDDLNLKVNTLGIMLECRRPKIDPVAAKIKAKLADLLTLPAARIGITATTGEELTAFGEGKGIQCFAIVSLVKR